MAETGKLLNRVLLPATEENFRYSEAALLNIDGKKELWLVPTVYGREGHDASPAQLIAWPSHDGGTTWDVGGRFVLQENIAKQNVMCPSFLRLSRGEILFFFILKNSMSDTGMWLRRSTDNGATWGEPQRLPYAGYGGAANDHVIRFRSGRIVVPCWVSYDELKSCYAYCFYSDDEGYTWGKSNEITVRLPSIARNTSPAAEEPAVIELRDGRVLMLVRTYVGWFYRSMSADGGGAWSEPANSGIPAPGSMPTLARIPATGDILLLFNYGELGQMKGAHPRTRMASAVSRDGGETFTSVRILDGEPGFPGKMTMANVAFVGDNALIFYSRSPDGRNHYSLIQQIVPIQWFYEGDMNTVYGQKYLEEAQRAGH